MFFSFLLALVVGSSVADETRDPDLLVLPADEQHLFISAGGDTLIHSTKDFVPTAEIPFLPPRFYVRIVSETEIEMIDVPMPGATPIVWGTGNILPCRSENPTYYYVDWTSGGSEDESHTSLYLCLEAIEGRPIPFAPE